MNDADLKKLRELIKEGVRPVKEIVEVTKKKVDNQELYLHSTAENVRLVKEQQSVINEKFDNLEATLNDPKTGLKRVNERMEALWDQVVEVTAGIEGVNGKLDSHSGALKRIESKLEQSEDDTKKLDKRLHRTETQLGIVPPAELTLFE